VSAIAQAHELATQVHELALQTATAYESSTDRAERRQGIADAAADLREPIAHLRALLTDPSVRGALAYDWIPVELRERPQWVLWRFEARDEKETKIPYRCDGNGRASSTDPSTWGSYEEARAACDVHGADGIGYVFSRDDPYVGVDLDAPLSETDRGAIMAALDSYAETSVSGNGVHVIVRASLNGHARNRRGPFEVYEQGRYFCMTGCHVRGTPTSIETRQEQLNSVLERFLPVPEPAAPVARPAYPVDVDDQELLEKARTARNGAKFVQLYDSGDWQGSYPSQSEADLRLCSDLAFWTGRYAARIDGLFRRSALMRAKWDTKRGDSTYGADTIARAVAECRDVYIGRGTAPAVASPGKPPSNGKRSTLAVRRLADVEARSIEWLERPLWQRAAFELLVGRKGSGKGTYLAGLASRVSLGSLFGEPKNVLIVASEDSDEIDLKPRVLAAGGDVTRIYSVTSALQLPRDAPALGELARDIADVGLIILDPVASHVRGDTHAEEPVRNAIDPLNALAHDLDCLIIGVRHLGKNIQGGAVAAVLGSIAWVNVPRAVIAVAGDDDEDGLFHIAVAAGNRSARGAGRTFRIELVDVGLKEKVTRAVDGGESAKSIDDLLGQGADKRRDGTKKAGAAEIILRELAQQPRPLDYLKAVAAAEVGASGDTTYRAAHALKAEGRAKPRNSGPGTEWLWHLTPSEQNASHDLYVVTDSVTKSALDSVTSSPSELLTLDDEVSEQAGTG
jgi:putative DNA primase/helicase